MDKPNKSTASIKHALGIADRGFLHHIRRTVADRISKDLGFGPWIGHAILGHAESELSQVYMPSEPTKLIRGALNRWSDELARILKARGRKVAE
jgi:hypothetical protein